jgi:hypothetical protein
MLRWMSKRDIEDMRLIEIQTDGVTARRIIYQTLLLRRTQRKLHIHTYKPATRLGNS